VPGSGHFIPEEHPAAVIEAVLRFAGDPAKAGT
jgi:pimeloyl-ACP methyl ester carboxylesterase